MTHPKAIIKNAGLLLNMDEFLAFSKENLIKFLLLDMMPYLEAEVDLFKAVLRWGISACHQKRSWQMSFLIFDFIPCDLMNLMTLWYQVAL